MTRVGGPCPECAQGKHDNCTHEALDPVTDEFVLCGCPHDVTNPKAPPPGGVPHRVLDCEPR